MYSPVVKPVSAPPATNTNGELTCDFNLLIVIKKTSNYFVSYYY